MRLRLGVKDFWQHQVLHFACASVNLAIKCSVGKLTTLQRQRTMRCPSTISRHSIRQLRAPYSSSSNRTQPGLDHRLLFNQHPLLLRETLITKTRESVLESTSLLIKLLTKDFPFVTAFTNQIKLLKTTKAVSAPKMYRLSQMAKFKKAKQVNTSIFPQVSLRFLKAEPLLFSKTLI